MSLLCPACHELVETYDVKEGGLCSSCYDGMTSAARQRKHGDPTPQPWFQFSGGHCIGGPHQSNGVAGIAMCGMRLREPDEIEANVLLMVASPALLAAAEELLAEIDNGHVGRQTAIDGMRREDESAATTDLRAAVAKARGRK